MDIVFDVRYDKFSDRYDIDKLNSFLRNHTPKNAQIVKIESVNNNHIIFVVRTK